MHAVVFVAVLLVSTFFSELTTAQSPPVCRNAASDYDNDGWGWEATFTGNYSVPTFGSCKIDGSSSKAPVYTNLDTGEPVSLIRPYWNAYRDFEGRTIQCDFYISDSNGYQRRLNYFYSNDFNSWTDTGFATTHYPIKAGFLWTGYAANIAYNGSTDSRVNYENPTTYWTVNDGIYYSNAGNKQNGREHALSAAQYIELIDDHAGAVRYWNYQDRYGGNGYVECFDTSGNRFQPSGYPG